MSPNLRRRAMLPVLALIGCAAAVSSGSRLPAALTHASPYLTRAEAAAIILLAHPDPLPAAPAAHPYVDVLPGDWFAPMMLAAATRRVLSPDETGTKLRPFGTVSRAQFLKMLSLSFKAPAHGPHAFADVASDAWHAPYAGMEQAYRLFAHADPSRMEPDRLVTQDEAAAAMERFLALRSKDEDERARDSAIAQTEGKVQLYTVISTKRTRVVFVRQAADGVRKLTGATFAKPAASSSASSHAPIDDVRTEILRFVNAARAEKNLAPVAPNAALERSAQNYADRMHAEGFFGHSDPGGGSLQDRIGATGFYDRSFSDDCQCIKGYALAENIARGQRTAEEVVKAWMDSPSHRDAILGKDFTDLGIGVRSGLWVQHFGGLLVPEKN